MLAAQIDEQNVVTGIYPVHDLDFMPRLVEDVTGQAGIGDTYDHETAQFIRPAVDVPPGEALDALKRRLAKAVDDTIAGVYNRWTRFQPEYAAREAAAREYAATSYAGTPSIWIRSFSVPAGLQPREAADLIIAQADTLHAALEALASLRMAKYAIQGAHDVAAAQAAYDSIIQQVEIIARSLQ